jgi:3-oxoacyl-[acyl-carrier protein] reductase
LKFSEEIMAEKTFENQVAVVTGAGEGIGFAIAQQLARLGASIVLNDVNAASAQEAAATIRADGGVCHSEGGDVSSVRVVRGLVEKAVSAFGRVDMAVCNAGITSWGDFFEYKPEEFDKVMGVNLRGSYFLAQAAARQMRAQKSGGRIVLTSSVTGHQAIRNLSAYGMTKAALEMMARNLVIELSPYGITINAVAPGPTRTPRNMADDPDYDVHWSSVVPVERIAEPVEMANAVLFFLSPDASFITGQTLIVDGGWTAISPVPSDYDKSQ